MHMLVYNKQFKLLINLHKIVTKIKIHQILLTHVDIISRKSVQWILSCHIQKDGQRCPGEANKHIFATIRCECTKEGLIT